MISKPPKIRLLIVDDHPVVLEGLRSMISSAPGIDLIGVCSSGEEALRLVARQTIDVMLIDMRMTPMNGVELLKRLRRTLPDCRGLILSSYQLDEEIFQAVNAGAAGYISKDALPNDILRSIRAVYEGERVFPVYILERLEQRRQKRSLTPRELEILEMVAKGLTNKEIGSVLGISQFTVRNQISSLSSKLEVSDRTEAARVALEQGIILL